MVHMMRPHAGVHVTFASLGLKVPRCIRGWPLPSPTAASLLLDHRAETAALFGGVWCGNVAGSRHAWHAAHHLGVARLPAAVVLHCPAHPSQAPPLGPSSGPRGLPKPAHGIGGGQLRNGFH